MTDIELINKVRDDKDSQALSELVNRHTGIYFSVVQGFSGSEKIQVEDIKEDRMYNIYKWALSFKPEKHMKFSTYVGEMSKYLCLDAIKHTPDKVMITENNEPASIDKVEEIAIQSDLRQEIDTEANKIDDDRFIQIFHMRHPEVGKPKTWREIGPIFGISRTRAQQIYERYLPEIKHHLKT